MRGLAGAPQLFANIGSGSASSRPSDLTPFTGPGGTPMLIFRARDGDDGNEPWITDGIAGTFPNTMQLADLESGSGSSDPRMFYAAPFGGVLFTARVNNSGEELWKSDGTADCIDSCNADALKTTAGDCGCGIADEDLDGSGVSHRK